MYIICTYMHVCIFIYVEHRAALYTQCRLPALLQHRMYTYICVICISYVYVYILHFHNMYIICTYLNICIYLYIVIIARHCVQCAAVCCSVLQCVAECCIVLQCRQFAAERRAALCAQYRPSTLVQHLTYTCIYMYPNTHVYFYM